MAKKPYIFVIFQGGGGGGGSGPPVPPSGSAHVLIETVWVETQQTRYAERAQPLALHDLSPPC